MNSRDIFVRGGVEICRTHTCMLNCSFGNSQSAMGPGSILVEKLKIPQATMCQKKKKSNGTVGGILNKIHLFIIFFSLQLRLIDWGWLSFTILAKNIMSQLLPDISKAQLLVDYQARREGQIKFLGSMFVLHVIF